MILEYFISHFSIMPLFSFKCFYLLFSGLSPSLKRKINVPKDALLYSTKIQHLSISAMTDARN